MADQVNTRKDTIAASINTKLASSKNPKISAKDYREVATDIVNYIDNRFLYAGSVNCTLNGSRDQFININLPITLPDTNYIVLGSFHTASPLNSASRHFLMIQGRFTWQFTLLVRSPDGGYSGTVPYEYVIYSAAERPAQ